MEVNCAGLGPRLCQAALGCLLAEIGTLPVGILPCQQELAARALRHAAPPEVRERALL